MFKAVYRRRKIEQILKRCHRPGYVFALRFPIVSRLGTGGGVVRGGEFSPTAWKI